MMVTLLGADPGEATEEAAHTSGAHAQFRFLENIYKEHM